MLTTNLTTQDFTNFSSTVTAQQEIPIQRRQIDLLADYYAARLSNNETQLLTKYAEEIVNNTTQPPRMPDPRVFMRRDLLGLVQDSYALGQAQGLDDIEEMLAENPDFSSMLNASASFALGDTPEERLEKNIRALQREIDKSRDINRTAQTLQKYQKTAQALQKTASQIGTPQQQQQVQEITQQVQQLQQTATARAGLRLVNQNIGKAEQQRRSVISDINQQLREAEAEAKQEEYIYSGEKEYYERTPDTQDYLVKRAIEEKLQYLETRRDSLQQTPPVVLDEDAEFFKWYSQKRLVPIANRYQLGLENKNKEAKEILTKYTGDVGGQSTTKVQQGDITKRVVNKLLSIESQATPEPSDKIKRPIKRVQRVVATELAIAYNIGRLKAYLKAGIQYVTISTSNYSPEVCDYCETTAKQTEGEPIKISSLLKNAYKNKGFNKDIKPIISDLRYLPNHPHCFVDGTMVTMYNRITHTEYQKNISEIVVGDCVKVPTKNKYQEVVKTHKNYYGKYLYKIRTNTGQTIIVTGNHPLWDGFNWREAQYFSVGDSLFTSSSESQRIDEGSIRVKQDYKECNGFVSTIKNQQSISNNNSESTWDSQDASRDVNREEQNKRNFEATQFRSDENKQSFKRSRSKKENVTCRYQNSSTSEPLYTNEQNSEWERQSLQKWFQREIRSFCKKWLGIECGYDFTETRSEISVRESNSIIEWFELSCGFLFNRLGCLHRSKRLLDRGRQEQIRTISSRLPSLQNGLVGQENIPTVNQELQGLDRVYISSIEKFVDSQFVYNISVVDDNMYFANGILSHNCYCFYKPHPKRDPQDKQESAGVYADPNSWKFILGAGLGVSLAFLAFALTTGRKISVPDTIPVPRLPSKLPTVKTTVIPRTVPIQAIRDQGIPPVVADRNVKLATVPSIPRVDPRTIRSDLRDPLSLRMFLNDLSKIVRKLNLTTQEQQDLENGLNQIARNPDLEFVDKALEAQLLIAKLRNPEYAKEVIDNAVRKSGFIKELYFRRFDKIADSFNKTISPQRTIDKLANRVETYVSRTEATSIINATKNIEKTRIDKQLQPISILRSDLQKSLERVSNKANKKEPDLLYIQDLQSRIADLDNFTTILQRQKKQLANIRASIRVVNTPVIDQQIARTQSIVERLVTDPSVLQEAQQNYETLLEMLVVLTPKEATKYNAVRNDLNRRIKNAQGIQLKRFAGRISNFSKYSI